MRQLILLAIFAALAFPGDAAGQQTIQALEQTLAGGPTKNPPDASSPDEIADTDLLQQLQLDTILARQIDGLELTERLTRVGIEKLVAAYQLGPQSRQALEQLADRSALLEPPASEYPPVPPPDEDTQRRMVEEARAYVLSILSNLPNLFAVRTTHRFDNLPVKLNGRDLPVESGLRSKGSFSREITFRDGKEVVNSAQSVIEPQTAGPGLESHGEFGPEPAIVLLDIRKGTIAFHHWEQTPSGLAAVYHYTVPSAFSRYQVNYNCSAKVPFHESPGYHGSLAIDPALGSVLRITLEVDGKRGDPVSHIASVIEYGPVVLGNRRYICPLRSLAFMVEEADACGGHSRDQKLRQPVAMLNQTSFTDYHRLGSSAKIVSEKPVDPPPDPSSLSSPPQVRDLLRAPAAVTPPDPQNAEANPSPQPDIRP
jgi:hypothetical protein